MELKKDSCNYLDVTRFIGIYLVIFAHFMFPFEYLTFKGFAFSFHMPLFFIVSGVLHKPQIFSGQNLFNLILALVVPYLLYNFFGFFYMLATGKTIAGLIPSVVSTLLVEFPITGASWFLVVLFWVKVFSLFLHSKNGLIAFSLFCFVFLFVTDSFELRFPHDNIFMLRSTLLSFPFFVIGYLIKDLLAVDIVWYKKVLLMLVCLVVNLVCLFNFGDIGVATLQYSNLFVVYPMATAGSLALIYFSQLISPWVKFGFVKDISRGAMMIVGLHFFVMFNMLPDIFFGVMPFRYIILLSVIVLFAFYIVIKLTYKRAPILYGKWKP